MDSNTKTEVKEGVEQKNPDYYWNSYAHFGIHEEMLKDEVRMRSYRNSILNNKHLIKDKVVLDVGCGTGIMSMFAAKAGAKKVVGIDFSDIVFKAQEIVKANKLDHIVTLVKGKAEEVDLTLQGIEPNSVDVIVSEWMGYCLLYESMLPSVLYVRDKWLKPGGVILPDISYLKICAIEDGDYKEDKIHFWDNVEGFDMSCIKTVALQEPLIDIVDPKQVMSTSATLSTIDTNTVKTEELAFKVPFRLVATRDDYCHAFVAYFDIEFARCHKKIWFSCAPGSQYTHWKQTVFYLNDVLSMKKGEEIRGEFSLQYSERNPRDLDLVIDYSFNGEHQQTRATQNYYLR